MSIDELLLLQSPISLKKDESKKYETVILLGPFKHQLSVVVGREHDVNRSADIQ